MDTQATVMVTISRQEVIPLPYRHVGITLVQCRDHLVENTGLTTPKPSRTFWLLTAQLQCSTDRRLNNQIDKSVVDTVLLYEMTINKFQISNKLQTPIPNDQNRVIFVQDLKTWTV